MTAIKRSDLLKMHEELGAKARELMTAKNQDYAVEADVFRNFRAFGTLGVLVRLSDKLARLRSFEENNSFAVKDEALVDTILDTINYAVIYFVMKQEGKETTASLKALTSPFCASGPYCDFCEELADFSSDDRSQYVCSNCAVERKIDTCQMCVMETV